MIKKKLSLLNIRDRLRKRKRSLPMSNNAVIEVELWPYHVSDTLAA